MGKQGREVSGRAGKRGRWVSRSQRVGGQGGTRGWVGEEGPEGRWVRRDQRVGKQRRGVGKLG